MASNWAKFNPVLSEGEIGIVIDEGKGYKIGDGVTHWNDLEYPSNPTSVVGTIGDSEVAVINQKGVSSLVGLDTYPVFSDTKPYVKGEIVNYGGLLYEFTADHEAGAWIGTDARETSLRGGMDSFSSRQSLAAQISINGILTSYLGLTKNILSDVKRFADKQLNSLGQIITMVGTEYPASDYIPVKPSTVYKFYSAGHIAWYDSEKNFLSYVKSVGNTSQTSHENAAFLVVCGGYAVYEEDDYYLKYKPYLLATNSNKGQRPIFIPCLGGIYIEGDSLFLKGYFYYLEQYSDMRKSNEDDDSCRVDLSIARSESGYIYYLMYDFTKFYDKGFVFIVHRNDVKKYSHATIWKGVVYYKSLQRYFIDEFDGESALPRYEGRRDFGNELSEMVSDYSYCNLIDYNEFTDSDKPYSGSGSTTEFYKVIDNIPCQEYTWYWGWSTGCVEVLNNQKNRLNIYHIENNGPSGLAFKTPKGAYSIRIYAAPTEDIQKVRLVMGRGIVDYSEKGVRKYKDPYFINPFWFDLVNSIYWVNQVSPDKFLYSDGVHMDYLYQIWHPIPGKTYTGNAKGFQAECYDINNELIDVFKETDKVFTIPEDTFYCKTYTKIGTESTVMVIPGTELPKSYIPYGKMVLKNYALGNYLNGRKYCALGDSITDGDGNASVSWYDYLLERLNADSSSLNFAESGQCLRTMADRCTVENMQNVNKVFVLGGTNQMSNFSIGSISDTPTPDLIEANRSYVVGEKVLGGPKEKHGNITPIYAYTVMYECTKGGNTGSLDDDFIIGMPTNLEQTVQVGNSLFKVIGYPTWYADMWRIVDRVWRFNDKCEIIWLIPIKTTSDAGKPSSEWSKKEKFQAIRDFCEYNSIRYIDLQKEFPLNTYTKDSIMADNLHPNKEGYKIICDIVMSHI